MNNPVMTASGTFGYGISSQTFLVWNNWEESLLKELPLIIEKGIPIPAWQKPLLEC